MSWGWRAHRGFVGDADESPGHHALFSAPRFRGPQDVDGLGDVADSAWAAAELAEYRPALELGAGGRAWARLASFCDSGMPVRR